VAEVVDSCCASCGIAEIDDIKLKSSCDDCDLVRYCSDECKETHRSQHEANCKERAAELRDELLFKQPESSHLGDCPICCLPFSINDNKYPTKTMQTCCSKYICMGCSFAEDLRQRRENILPLTCPFCRQPVPEEGGEMELYEMIRVSSEVPVAMVDYGKELDENGDRDGAMEYFTKAADMGDGDAHYQLALMYDDDDDDDDDDMAHEEARHDENEINQKETYHLEEAAIRGHTDARFNLACNEEANARMDRAVKHWIIAANLGCDDSLQQLKKHYKSGDVNVSKDDFASALRAHQAAVDATKSPQREAANSYHKMEKASSFLEELLLEGNSFDAILKLLIPNGSYDEIMKLIGTATNGRVSRDTYDKVMALVDRESGRK